MKLFSVEIAQRDGGIDVALSGEIDLSTIEELQERLKTPLEDDPGLIVLDLREVSFLDSSGLRLILRLNKRQEEGGGRLVLVRGGRRVARVLEVTGTDRQLEQVDDPAEIAAP
ncbi:MAG: STAS domain-containing protein [Thermoleophilaceae bacterium]|jgi:anti-anti-sigma factor|nr:STAS domain-containing protein [Thermoleophilaceae bacterium]